jgi:hypothetical protein
MPKNKEIACRVCGYLDEQDPPWGEDGETPSFDICVCCGVTHGYQDTLVESVKKYRKTWMDSGCQWETKRFLPTNWNASEQLENVPPEYI